MSTLFKVHRPNHLQERPSAQQTIYGSKGNCPALPKPSQSSAWLPISSGEVEKMGKARETVAGMAENKFVFNKFVHAHLLVLATLKHVENEQY